jgi:hypothetical protein
MFVINRVTHEQRPYGHNAQTNKAQSEDIISIIYSVFDFLRELLNRVSENLTDKRCRSRSRRYDYHNPRCYKSCSNPELSEEDFFLQKIPTQQVVKRISQPPSISGGNEEMMYEAQTMPNGLMA